VASINYVPILINTAAILFDFITILVSRIRRWGSDFQKPTSPFGSSAVKMASIHPVLVLVRYAAIILNFTHPFLRYRQKSDFHRVASLTYIVIRLPN